VPEANRRALAGLPATRDAPYDLADDQDLEYVRAEYEALPRHHANRPGQRARLVAEYARRIDSALARGARDRAFDDMIELFRLWTADELADGTARRDRLLLGQRQRVERIRRFYARTGNDVRVGLALIFLLEMAPSRSQELEQELNTLFAFADDLSAAEHGDGARGARPIQILEQAMDAFATRYAVERLVQLYRERQQQFAKMLDTGSPQAPENLQAVQAHGTSVLRTAWNIARLYLRAGRLDEIEAAIKDLRGVGDSPGLRSAVARAVAKGADSHAWFVLAMQFLNSDSALTDPPAALAACRQGLARFPADARLASLASAVARQMAHLPLAIFFAKLAHQHHPNDRTLADELAELYTFEVGQLANSGRLEAAARAVESLEHFFRTAQARWRDEPLQTQLADSYAAMGRGLLAHGEIADALRYLRRSLSRGDSVVALEALGTIHLKRAQFNQASRAFRRALALPVGEHDDRIGPERVRRLLAEAEAGANRQIQARAQLTLAIERWNEVPALKALWTTGNAEALVEIGRLRWAVGDHADAIATFELALDADPDNAGVHAEVVSFLIVRGHYEDAVDAYHRALGSAGVGDYFKVYMSLWILAEERRAGRADDPNAVAYLASRTGPLWHDQLARFAVGKLKYETLLQRANTRGRRAELFYYAAMLNLPKLGPSRARNLLGDVLATEMMMFFEYDMARYILSHGLIEQRAEIGSGG
jgi:tetratricopeptide (TPR) repeat protein